jgi:hypothetical protein
MNDRSRSVAPAGACQLPPQHLPLPDGKALINAKVAVGYYQSANEVV